MHYKLIALQPEIRYIVVGGLLLIILIVRGIQFLSMSGNPAAKLPLGAQRDYGLGGGAVCPKCHRPFRLSLMELKLFTGIKFARCEFCGKWSVVRRLSLDELRKAEAAELAEAQSAEPIHEKSADEKLNALVEDSRFTDKP